jgi:hypothetical protein
MPSVEGKSIMSDAVHTTAEFRRLVPVSDRTLRAWRTKGML